MLKIILGTVHLCVFSVVISLGQVPSKSAEIYEFGRQIDAELKNRIWDEFEFHNYSRPKTDSSGGFMYFSTEPDNKDNQTFTWRLTDDYFKNQSLEDSLVIAFHEAFHAFERDPKRTGEKWKTENASLVFEYQETSARNNALFRIESRLLRSALESGGDRDLKQKAAEFLAVRKLRQSEIEPRFVEFEKNAELNEGLAEYTGTSAVIQAIDSARRKRLNVPFIVTNSKAFRTKKFEILDSIMTIGQNIRRKFYYTGSAQGFLLDRLMPDWKAQVQMNGASVQDLLEKSVGALPNEPAVTALLAQNGYDKTLIEEQVAVTARKTENQRLLESTLAQEGRKYIIDFSSIADNSGIRNFDPMNVTMISPKIRVHTRMVTFGSDGSFKAAYTQPVVENLDSHQYIAIVPENREQKIAADGKSIDPSQPAEIRFEKSLTIDAQEFKLEAKAGSLTISAGEITIRLEKR